MSITFLTQFYSFQDALSLIDAGGAGLTKLIIMTVIYLAVEALGLSLLCGPLRKALSFGNEEKNRAVLPLLILGILFFKHKADVKLVLSLLITFVGVAIATVFSPAFSIGGTRTGMVCMMFGVIAASMYSLSSKKASADFDAATVTTFMALEGGILFNIIALCQGYRLDTYLILFTDWSIMGNMLFLSVFCAFASYVCYNKLLSYVEPALGNNIVSSLSTVIGVVAGIIVMGDLWGWYTIFGMAVTLAGVWLASMRMREDL